MAYRKPFTPLQRRDAVRAYKSYRKHRSQLRRRFPPADAAHRELLDAYKEVVDEMQAELQKPDRGVDVDVLNRADAAAQWLALEYWKLQYPGR